VVNRWVLAIFAATVLTVLLVVACEPSLNDTTFEVTSPRVLAVRSEVLGDGGVPTDIDGATIAEAIPGNPANGGGAVTLTALYVGPDGGIAGPFDWAFCVARNPLANLEPVSPTCDQASGPVTVFQEIGASPTVTALVPGNGCNNFGPEAPLILAPDGGEDGGEQGRPVDPDSTGGYYQPVRLVAGDQIAQAFIRINCGTAGATPEQMGALSTPATVANTNPVIESVVDLAEDGGKLFEHVTVSQPFNLRANWAPCSTDDATCTGSQQYALLDPLTFEVAYPYEQMRVSWFSTAGTFANDTTAPDGGAMQSGPTPTYADNSWTAPDAPQTVHMWVVLRDDRGGVGWASYVFEVNPD
jgi:hypothetical protein